MTMTAESVQPSRSGTGPGGWVHFGVAAGVLLVAAGAWFVVLPGLLSKKPVPPPEGTQLDDTHLLRSFPEELGPYVLAPEAEAAEPDAGKKDGIHEMDKDELQTLGTLKHEWNWYYMATYRDTRAPNGAGYVRLDITYFTGLVQAVPHVPERCLVAGGNVLVPADSRQISVVVPGVEPPWDNIQAYRTVYQWTDNRTGRSGKGAQYHFFSSNGLPQWRWETVRLEMGHLFKKYRCFAKIQLAPHGSQVASLADSDDRCRDFLTYALPAILKFLPTAADVEKLEASGD